MWLLLLSVELVVLLAAVSAAVVAVGDFDFLVEADPFAGGVNTEVNFGGFFPVVVSFIGLIRPSCLALAVLLESTVLRFVLGLGVPRFSITLLLASKTAFALQNDDFIQDKSCTE